MQARPSGATCNTWPNDKVLFEHAISCSQLAEALFALRLYAELTGVNDEIGDLEDRLAALKDKADNLGKKYVQAKKGSEKADREVQVRT